MTINDVDVPEHLTTMQAVANWIIAKLAYAGAAERDWETSTHFWLPATLDGQTRPGAQIEVEPLHADPTGERLCFIPSGGFMGVEIRRSQLLEPMKIAGSPGAQRVAVAVSRAHGCAPERNN